MDLSEEIVERPRAWAASQKPVRALWLFGSRAKSRARPDSDTDIALELMPKAGTTDWAFADSISCGDEWKTELRLLTGGAVSLIVFRDDLPGRFDPKDGGICLWSRPSLRGRLPRLVSL